MYANKTEFMEAPIEDCQKAAIALVDEYDALFLDPNEFVNEESIDVGYISDVIEFTTSITQCGCCYETNYYTLPLSYLWTENWKELAIKEKEEKLAIEETAKQERANREKEKLYEQRYRRYLELKQEFEPQPLE